MLMTFFVSLLLSITNVYAQEDIAEEKKTIKDIVNEWKDIEDEELNDIIGNSEDIDIANFLLDLSEEELKEILSRNTMLLNTITFYKPIVAEIAEDEVEQEVESKETYWKYLISLANKPMTLAAGTATTKTGYFYIVIEGNGSTTKRKVQVTITNTNLSNKQTAKFSEVAVSGYSDSHKFTIISASTKTELADKYYAIFALKFSYTKPAHYLAKGSYSDKCSGYRFNFSPYSQDNSLPTTVNNTGHNKTNTTETIQMQINIMNTGMMKDEDGKTYHATGKITLSLYYGGLKIDPNGGTWNNSTDISTFTAKCGTTKNIANPTMRGYKFSGWTVINGNNANGSIKTNSNGTTFTYCGSSASFTTLKANWTVIELEMPEAGSNSKLIIITIGLICFICVKFIKIGEWRNEK